MFCAVIISKNKYFRSVFYYNSTLLMKLRDLLFKQVPGYQLALFRICFGVILFFQFLDFKDMTTSFFAVAKIQLTYDFFHFVKPLPAPYLEYLYYVLMGFSVLFTLGIFYRVSAFVLFVGFSYTFLLDHTFYNNHFYLFIIMILLMMFTHADRWLSLKLTPKPKLLMEPISVPYWQVLMLQLQLFIMYFYGGIAKLNQEWLFYAQPVQAWLPDMLSADLYASLTTDQLIILAYFISYSGLLIDLLAGFMLLNKRTFPFIAVVLFIFHFSNSLLFNIGLFPWFGIVSLVLFVPQCYIEKFTDQITRENTHAVRSNLVIAMLALWFGFQFLFPLRHHAMPGWVFWGERGYKFSWFMKLRTKEPSLSIKVNFDNNPQNYYVQINEWLTKKQARSISYKPLLLAQFAQKLAIELKDEYQYDIRIYGMVHSSLHDHPAQHMIDTTADLTKVDALNDFYFKKLDWTIPFDPYAQ